MGNTTRFDGKGEIYAKARPTYAAALLAYLQNHLLVPAGAVFADIGSGTGIFTKQLLACGYTVYAVEPNADMRRKAEETLGGYDGFHSVTGVDSDTTLPNNSVDYITVAQAFHWFDAAAFKQECQRILKPGGRVFLIYNSRIPDAACTQAISALYSRYSAEFHGFSNGIGDEACRAFFHNDCEVLHWDNSPVYDRQSFVDRMLSSSYSLQGDDPRFEAYIGAINDLFDRFAVDGKITVPTNTVAYIGR